MSVTKELIFPHIGVGFIGLPAVAVRIITKVDDTGITTVRISADTDEIRIAEEERQREMEALGVKFGEGI